MIRLSYTIFFCYCTVSKSYYYNNSPSDDKIRRYLEASRPGKKSSSRLLPFIQVNGVFTIVLLHIVCSSLILKEPCDKLLSWHIDEGCGMESL